MLLSISLIVYSAFYPADSLQSSSASVQSLLSTTLKPKTGGRASPLGAKMMMPRTVLLTLPTITMPIYTMHLRI